MKHSIAPLMDFDFKDEEQLGNLMLLIVRAAGPDGMIEDHVMNIVKEMQGWQEEAALCETLFALMTDGTTGVKWDEEDEATMFFLVNMSRD